MLLAASLAVAALPLRARAQAAAGEAAWDALREPGAVVLFRHANAPGIGDPSGFRLDDCRTQRNLDEAGRAQARRLGERFRQRGIVVGQVLTSQWCRARDTARLAFPQVPLREEPLFNSTFGAREASAASAADARALLRQWRGPGVLVVVSHQVNISALAGSSTASGEGLVVRPGPDGALQVVARIDP